MRSKQARSRAKATSPAAGMLEDFFTEGDLSIQLGVARITLARWRLQRQGPPVTLLGRRVLYRKSSVRDWLAAQEKPWAASA
jgi:hypothetical protein